MNTQKQYCCSCALTLSPPDGGAAEVQAYWVDEDGVRDDEPRMVCRSCLEAGCPTGPGYVACAEVE